MLNQVMKDILTIAQLLLFPAIFMMYRYMRKQIIIARDIHDLKIYTKAICKELKLTCTLEAE